MYRYDAETDTEYYCDIPVITQKQQEIIIQDAIKNCPRTDRMKEYHREHLASQEHYKNNLDYVENHHVPGFCKNFNNCNNHANIPFTPLNCVSCSAKWLVRFRKIFKGVDMLFDFDIDNSENDDYINVNDKWKPELMLFLDKGVAQIQIGDKTICSTNEFNIIIRTDRCPVFKFKNPVQFDGKTLCGKLAGNLIGRPVCKSLLYGNMCRSMTGLQTVFTMLAVPRGYPNWAENTHKGTSEYGDIYIHHTCLACNMANPKSSGAKMKMKNHVVNPQYSIIDDSRRIHSPKFYAPSSPSSSSTSIEDENKRLIFTIHAYKSQMEQMMETVANLQIELESKKEENRRLKLANMRSQYPNNRDPPVNQQKQQKQQKQRLIGQLPSFIH